MSAFMSGGFMGGKFCMAGMPGIAGMPGSVLIDVKSRACLSHIDDGPR